MNRWPTAVLILTLIALGALAACAPEPGFAPTPTATPRIDTGDAPVGARTPEPQPTAGEAESADDPPATVVATSGPDDFPPGVNPLTGLAVDDPTRLARPPLLIKVSNQSDDVRPQSGLSSADHVWIYHMEGWGQTRYTAVVYGESPEYVGSVRSVRLIDTDHLIPMYDGLLVYSGGSNGMNDIIAAAPWRRRTFTDDGSGTMVRLPDTPRAGVAYYHVLFARPEAVWAAAVERGVSAPPDLRGLRFDAAAPPGGTPTDALSVDFPGRGPRQLWRYDASSGSWLSWTEMQLVSQPQATPDEDYLTGEQLAFENVVVIWADHYLADFIEDEPSQLYSVGVTLTGEGEAVLLRDGQRYEVTWRRDDREAMIQFFGADGQIIPLKPGQTWFHVALPPSWQFAPEVLYNADVVGGE